MSARRRPPAQRSVSRHSAEVLLKVIGASVEDWPAVRASILATIR